PAYDWTSPDSVLKSLHEARIDVVVTLYGTPRWANGGNGPNFVPRSKAALAAFARATALRYPWVRRWLIWNEPNQRIWLRPTSPRVYTQTLLNPAYAALHAVRSGMLVGGAVTAPRGATGGVSPVDMLINFLVRDEPDVGRWQSGLLNIGGVAKPAYYAFSLPLAEVSRHGSTTVLWGQVRPGTGQRTYELQQLVFGRWKIVGGLARTDSHGFLRRTVHASGGGRFRLVAPSLDL